MGILWIIGPMAAAFIVLMAVNVRAYIVRRRWLFHGKRWESDATKSCPGCNRD